MIRSQIYLTAVERKQLHALTHDTGKSQSELIRIAIDQFIERQQQHKEDKLALLRQGKGLWKNRDDLPDFTRLREEFDRY